MAEMWWFDPANALDQAGNNPWNFVGLSPYRPKLAQFQFFTCREGGTAQGATGTCQIFRKFVSIAKTKPHCAGNNGGHGIDSIP